jgi:hypothetical protein
VGKLSAERVALLEALPGWVWSVNAAAWADGLSYLELFISLHTSLPTLSESVLGFPVGSWVKTQRRTFSAGTLPAERVALLEAVPGWAWNARDATWAEALRQLVNFRAEYGHLNVPSQYVSPSRQGVHMNVQLGTWVRYQKYSYLKGHISEQHKADLNAIAGWEWRNIPSSR